MFPVWGQNFKILAQHLQVQARMIEGKGQANKPKAQHLQVKAQMFQV